MRSIAESINCEILKLFWSLVILILSFRFSHTSCFTVCFNQTWLFRLSDTGRVCMHKHTHTHTHHSYRYIPRLCRYKQAYFDCLKTEKESLFGASTTQCIYTAHIYSFNQEEYYCILFWLIWEFHSQIQNYILVRAMLMCICGVCLVFLHNILI